MTATRIVTLTTDFGLRSAYVGSLRGVLLTISPELILADISHEITPFNVAEAALVLRAAVPYYPGGTVHLAVIDPGVGTERRPLIAAWKGQLFVGPDNGLFTPFLDGARIWEIGAEHITGGGVSATFHGRDLFAPVAARLALGEKPDAMGKPAGDPVRLDWPEPQVTGREVRGVVLHVDTFGNLITNIPAEMVGEPGAARVEIGGVTVNGVRHTYGDAAAGDLVALIGSTGLLEVAVARGSAVGRVHVAEGGRVRLVRGGAEEKAPR